jgi:4-amino-4-deoxy-L-arabinose transferase-like glycosyltransferase
MWMVLDGVWLFGLALYVLLGVDKVPFHGDEATLIYMSHDYHDLIIAREPQRLLFREHPVDPADQKLRVLNGTVGKMAMGLSWHSAGLTIHDVSQQWVWDWTMEQNAALGHMPEERMLHAARISSALLMVLSMFGVYAIAALVSRGQRPVMWLSSLIYTTSPAILLNGRRAMMEGSMLAFTTLTILATILVVRAQARGASRRELMGWTVLLGVMAGFAFASKHNALIIVGAAFFAVLTEPLLRRGRPGTRFDRPHLIRLAASGSIMMITFVALNPAWWNNPLTMPGHVLDARENLLKGQVEWYGGYDSKSEQTTGAFHQLFFAAPQYYEDSRFQSYVGDEIDAYDSSWLSGRGNGVIGGSLLLAMFAFGLGVLCDRWRQPSVWVMLLWMGITGIALILVTPLEWQRYYLPLFAPMSVVTGVGTVWVVTFVIHTARGMRRPVAAIEGA